MTAKSSTPKATSRDNVRKSSATNATSRPKSAPKKRVTVADEDEGGSSEVPEVDEYSSVEDESSEEDIPLPEEEDEEVGEELDDESEASEVSEEEDESSLRGDGHRNNKVR